MTAWISLSGTISTALAVDALVRLLPHVSQLQNITYGHDSPRVSQCGFGPRADADGDGVLLAYHLRFRDACARAS